MGFWDIFVKIWQVRTSIKIQKSLENLYRVAKDNAEIQANMPDIIIELDKKNQSWGDKMNHHRKKSDK